MASLLERKYVFLSVPYAFYDTDTQYAQPSSTPGPGAATKSQIQQCNESQRKSRTMGDPPIHTQCMMNNNANAFHKTVINEFLSIPTDKNFN